MSINKHELLGVPKQANQHRLSRLTMEVHTDELRIMAVAVESYTDELIAALEAAEKRIAELEAREVVLPQRMEPEGYHIDEAYLVAAEDGDYFDRDEVIEAIRAAGIITRVGE